MVVEILFIVFMVLWLASLLPQAQPHVGPYAGFIPWICAALLGFALFLHHGI